MANYFERTWRIRDAVLTTLAINTANGQRMSAIRLDDVTSAVPWDLDPMSEEEVRDAAGWLFEEEFLTGTRVMGGGVMKPRITPKGERLITNGRSVRDDPADRQIEASPFTLNTNGGVTTVAVNSPGAHQTVTVSDSFQKFEEFAQAVERAVADVDPEVHQQGVDLVQQIRDELATPEPRIGWLKRLLQTSGMTIAASVASTVGSGAATELIQLAAGAI